MTAHNQPVLRRAWLAVLLCLSLWAVATRAFDAPVEVDMAAAEDSRPLSDVPGDGDGSPSNWNAAQPASICGAASWTPQLTLQDIDVTGIARRHDRGVVRLRHARACAPPSRPLHLHDIPLLI